MLRAGWILLRDAALAWQRDNAPRLGAALAFYTIFSLAPLFVVALGVASIAFERQQVQSEITSELHGLIGEAAEDVIEILLKNAFDAYSVRSGVVTSIVGIAVLLLVASAVLNELRNSLDTIWHTSTDRPGGLMRMFWGRLISLAMVLGIGFLLLASLLLSTALAALTRFLSKQLMMPVALIGAFDVAVNLLFLTLLFAFLYKFLPDISLTWKDVWLGAAVAALLFTVGKWAIGLYIGNSVVASAYGAAGSLVIFLLWVYFTAQLFFFGAEFGKVYAERYGSLRNREA